MGVERERRSGEEGGRVCVDGSGREKKGGRYFCSCDLSPNGCRSRGWERPSIQSGSPIAMIGAHPEPISAAFPGSYQKAGLKMQSN